jgi:hypothetical protein
MPKTTFLSRKAVALFGKHAMRRLTLVLILILSSLAFSDAQPWTYNFGTGTGSFTSSTASESFLPNPPNGTDRVRVGTNPGSITLANPGIALGLGSELQISSNTGSSSTTKFSVYDYTASKSGYVKFKIAFNGGTNGVYNFTIGDGGTFSDNTAISTAQIFAGLRWSLLASNAVTYEVLNNTTYGATGISNSTTLFAQSTSNEYLVEIYYNNTTGSLDYDRSATTYSVANAKWDLWVNGTLVGNDLAKGALGTDLNIDSYAFNHQVSASTPGTIYIDDIEYSNALPAAPVSPLITTTGTLSALSSSYGTASSNTQFSVSGANMTAGISVNPPAGFQVSTSSDFASNVGSNGAPITVGAAGTISATPVYVRLSATAIPGTYSGNINLTSSGADAKTVATASSTVSQKNLTITGAVANSKSYDGSNSATIDLSGASLSGIVGSDDVTIDGTSATASFDNADAGNSKSVIVSGIALVGAESSRYTLSQPTGLTANISKADQTITFAPLDDKQEDALPFALTATASSGLAVTYISSNTSVATVSGSTVTIIGVGTTTITAEQIGNDNYNPAPSVDQELEILPSGKDNQTITFNTLADVTYGDAPFALTATASSDLTVSYVSSDTTVATISGSTLTIVSAGTITITASQGGDDDYNPAPSVQQTLVINPAELTLTGPTAADKIYDGSVDAVISGTLTGVLFSDDVTFNGDGSFASASVNDDIAVTANITLSGSKSSNYTIVQPTGLTADISAKELTISSASATDKVYDGLSNATITGSLDGVVSGDDVDFDGVGFFASTTVGDDIDVTSISSLTGSEATNYFLNQPTGLSADITPKALTITGAEAADKNYDGNTATTISGTLSGIVGVEEVTLIGTGTFINKNAGSNKPVTSTSTLDGADAGNYIITQPLGLTADISSIELTVSGALAENKLYDGNTNATISGTLSGVISPDEVNLNGTGTFADPNVATAITVTSTSTLTGADAINYFLTQPTGLSADISKADQTITFGALTNRTFGDAPFALTATSSSGLAVSYSSSNTNVATISGNTVTIVGVGTTSITASQAGDNNFNAATNVQQSLTVVPGVILAWQFGNPESTGSETTYNSTTTASNLSVSPLSRGNGISATGLGRGFSANNFTVNGTKADAINNNKFFQFTITVGAGRRVSLDKLNARLRRTAAGPNSYQWRYSIDGINFTDIGSEVSFTSTADGVDQTPIDLSGITALQNVNNPQVITLRLYAWGATTTTGTLAIGRYGTNVTTNSLSLTGAISQIPAPVISSSLTSSGTVGVAYSYNITASNAPTSFNATGLPAGLIINTSSGAITGTPTEAGSFEVTISATNLTGTTNEMLALEIAKGNQTITFNTLDGKTFGDAPFELSATSSAGLSVSYESSDTSVATVSGSTVTIVGAGSTDIIATQSGNSNYDPATPVIRTLTVSKANQAISFEALPVKYDTSSTYELVGTSTSGLPVTFTSSDEDILTIAGSTVTITGIGTAIITASQNGNDNFNPATPINQEQLVLSTALDNQTITFDALNDVTYGDASFQLTATASSGLDVTYTSSNTDVATISGDELTIVGVGTATITASQPGNVEFNPATSVQQALTVNPKNLTVTGLTVVTKVYDGTDAATLDFSLSSIVGVVGADDVSISGGASFEDADAGENIAVTTALTLGGIDAVNYSFTQPSGLTGIILKAEQTIVFGPIANKNTASANFSPGATSTTSGINPITYTSTNTGVAVIMGDSIDVIGAGVSTIIASQAGSSNYNPANSVSQTLTVTNLPANVTWTFGTTTSDSTSLPVGGESIVNGLTISRMGRGNNNGVTTLLTTTSASNNSGASGSMNIGAASRNGGLDKDTSTYFDFTLSPVNGKRVTLNSINFGQRSTSSGPQAYSIRSSQDNFNSSIGTGSLNNNSTWAAISPSISATSSSFGSPITFRIYGHNGAGAPFLANNANWRLDDVSINVLLEDLPACTGTPDAGTLVVSNASVCLNGATSISLNGHSSLSENGGLAYKWFSSTDNENFSLVNGETGESIQTGTLSATTYYFSEVTCLASGFSSKSDTVAVTVIASSSNTTTASACGSYTWSVNNETYTSSTIDTILNGCDTSILIVDITPINISNTTVTACDFYLWSVNNQTYTSSAIDTVVNGCDTSFLNLTITPAAIWYLDTDNDGWYISTQSACSSPGSGWTDVLPSGGSDDCDDNNPAVNPGVTEICGNSIDDNCNGEIDEDCVADTPITSPIGQISGAAFVACTGIEGEIYSISPVPNASTYTWAVTGGIQIISGQGSTQVSVNFPNGYTTGSVRVRASNNVSQTTERVLTIRSVPTGTPGAISGTTAGICAGSSGSYSINPVGNTNSYEWAIQGTGATISENDGTTSVTVAFATGFSSAILQVRAVNDCGVSGWRSLALSSGVDALGTPGAISGATQGCPLTTQTYSIPAIAGATDYIWRTTGGIAIIGGQGTTSAEMSFPVGFLSGSIFVKAANTCGESREVRINVTGITKIPGAISGQSTLVCANTSKTYSIAPVAGASSYLWSTTGDIALNSANGTEATFDFGPSFVSGTIEVQAVNACGPSAVRKLTVRSNVPARPGIISGITAGLCADQSTVYSINAVSLASSYLWTWVGDLDVIAGQGSRFATFSAGSGFETGQIIVQAANACGTSPTRVLNVRSTPLRPGVIAGPGPDVIKGSEDLNYSINPVPSATQYNWSGTNGISISSGNGSTAVSADIPVDFGSGVIQVIAVNACGESLTRVRSLKGVNALPFMRGDATSTAPEISIYPNPTRNKVIVQGSGISEIHLYDLSGKLLQAHRYQDAYQEEIILNYPQGMYIIQVFGAGWNTQHKVVVAQ